MKRKKKTLDIDLRYVTVTDVTVYSGGLLLLSPPLVLLMSFALIQFKVLSRVLLLYNLRVKTTSPED